VITMAVIMVAVITGGEDEGLPLLHFYSCKT
jgi:hypothetical protein